MSVYPTLRPHVVWDAPFAVPVERVQVAFDLKRTSMRNALDLEDGPGGLCWSILIVWTIFILAGKRILC